MTVKEFGLIQRVQSNIGIFILWEHSYMTSDFWVGRYVKLHLMISDVKVGWVGHRGSGVRSAIFEFLLFPFISRF